MNFDWTPEVADELAKREGLALEETHWLVITTVREAIARYGRAPSLRETAALCAMTVDELKALFPGAAERVLARLAGAPEFERSHA
jgi:tRNA 2-thiouridine synthesizing protein E